MTNEEKNYTNTDTWDAGHFESETIPCNTELIKELLDAIKRTILAIDMELEFRRQDRKK